MAQALDISDLSKQEVKDTLNECRHPIDIAVFDSSNYFNLGAIIRTAHNFLVRNIYQVDNTDGYYPKATMGARNWENVIPMASEEFFKTFSDRSMIACERRFGLETETLYTFSWPDNPIVMFGGEKMGLSDQALATAKNIVSVPVFGILHDYNVATCAGIILYDWSHKYYRKQQNVT